MSPTATGTATPTPVISVEPGPADLIVTRARPGIRPFALLAVMAWLAGASPVGAQEPGAEPVTRIYIVQLRNPPAVIVARDVRRMGKFDARAEAVRSYAAEQVERHDQLLQAIGAPDAKRYSYKLSFNGFAARLTVEQAAKLSADPAVARVWEDRARTLRTNASANYLGLLTAPDGLRTPLGLQGEDIVIGVIDSGIATGHKSFADTETIRAPRVCRSDWSSNSLLGKWLCRRFKSRKTLVYDEPEQWRGRCETGEGFTRGVSPRTRGSGSARAFPSAWRSTTSTFSTRRPASRSAAPIGERIQRTYRPVRRPGSPRRRSR